MVTRSSRPRSLIRASMNRFCSAAIVMPVTRAPKCSAACSDIEPQPQPTSSRVMPGSRPSLRQTSDELVELRLLHRYVGRGVVAAGVGHLRLEDQLVELVGEVVVERDRAPVAQRAVQPAAQPRLRPRGRGRAAERADPGGGADRLDQGPGRRTPAGQPALARHGERVRERRVEVTGDVELAGHVGLGGAELARVPQQPAHGVDRVEHDQRRVDRAGDRVVPGLQPDRQVAADERPERLLEAVRDHAVAARR